MAHRLARTGTALAAAAVLMLPTAASADSAHNHASPSADPHAGHGTSGHDAAQDDAHEDHAPPPNEDDGGDHTDHGTAPDSVSPEVRNLVLSGFAGVNAAVIFGAWMLRRTGPDPDPRKRTPKASR